MSKKAKKNKRVDVSKLTPKQKKAYKRQLEYVRSYCKARTEWNRKLRSGEVDKTVTLSDFRLMKAGKSASKAKPKDLKMANVVVTVEDINLAHEDALADNALVTKLQNLISEIKGSQKRNAALADLIKKIG